MGLREDTWVWLRPALDDLRTTTDRSWEERRNRFVELLGLSDAEQHPVPAEFVRRLDELPDEERTALLASDQVDVVAYELVQTFVSEPDGVGESTRDDYAEVVTDDGDMDWVTAAQAAGLVRIFGPDWQPLLAEELTERWGPDWREHPAEHKTAWLSGLIGSDELPMVSDEMLAELRVLIDNIPGSDRMSDEELAKVVHQIATEQGVGA